MIEVKDITAIDLKSLDEKIQNQLKERDNNDELIKLCNITTKMAIPISCIITTLLVSINFLNEFNNLSTFFLGITNLIFLEAITLGSIAIFTTIIKNKTKKNNKRLIKELNNNISIQREIEFNKNKSIEVKEEILSTIQETDLPEISIINSNSNIKTKPKKRTLKKDNNNVRK